MSATDLLLMSGVESGVRLLALVWSFDVPKFRFPGLPVAC